MKISQISSLVLLTLLVSFPVSANKPKKFSISSPQGFSKAPELEVYSKNGEKYTTVDKTDQSKVTIKINIDCKYEGKGNKAYDGDLRVPGYIAVSKNDPPDFLIPGAKEASRVFRFDNGEDQPMNPVNICNNELEKKLSQNADKTKYHIMAKGFNINYPAALKVEYRLQCKGIGLGKSSFDVKRLQINTRIACKASDLAKAKIPKPKPKPKRKKTPPKRAKPLVKNISFKAKPEVQVANCPAHIDFVGHIEASRKGKVTYRYIKHDGKQSPLFTLKFDKAGIKKTREWGLTAARPKTTSQFKASGTRDSPYEIQGYYRMVIESPAPGKETKATYKIDCDKKKGKMRGTS